MQTLRNTHTKKFLLLKNLFLIGAIFMLSSISNLVFSRTFSKYHNLSDNLVESENYEIRKLINGAVEAVIYVKGVNVVLVVTEGYIWKINDQGYVIDTIRRTSNMHSSGLILWNDSWSNSQGESFWYKKFNEWIYSGNKLDQIIHPDRVMDTGKLSDLELKSLIDQAELVEFSYYRKDKTKHEYSDVCLLRSGNQLTVLDMTNRFGKIDSSCYEYRNRNHNIWKESCLKGYDKTNKNILLPLSNSLAYGQDWEDQSQPIYMQKFSREFYYFEEGFGGWLLGATLGRAMSAAGWPGGLPESYWYGSGYFQLNHQSEQLNFKALVSKRDDGINFKNISLHEFPKISNSDTKFIDLTFIGGVHNYLDKIDDLVKYHEDDVGFYAIRKKAKNSQEALGKLPRSNITPGQPSSYHSANPWQPVFTGMMLPNPDPRESTDSTWGNINFFDVEVATRHYLLDVAAVPAGLHAIPRTLSFNWNLHFDLRGAFKLYLEEEKFVWYHPNRDDRNIFLEFIFDEDEIVAAFQKLDNRKQTLQLEVHLERIEKVGASLSILLRNDKESIRLKNTKFVTVAPRYLTDKKMFTQQFEKGKLKIEYDAALKDGKNLQTYLDLSADIAANSPYVKEYFVWMSGYANDLINDRMGKKDYKEAEIIINHFIDKLLPHTGKVGKSAEETGNIEVIASNSLALAMMIKDENLSTRIFENLLGSTDFNIAALNNATLSLNVACYYATHKNKNKLLQATKQALLRGKKAEAFMKDTDFKEYWNDPDFLKVLVPGDKGLKGELKSDKDAPVDTPLHLAILADKKDKIESLLAEGADINAPGKFGQTPLHLVAKTGNKEVAELLISKGADVNSKVEGRGDSKDTPLHWAASFGSIGVAQLLIAKRAEVNVKNRSGRTPLHVVMQRSLNIKALNANISPDKLLIVKLLIEHGAEINDARDDIGQTILHLAAVTLNREMLELMLGRNLDVNAKDEDGRTPLHLAAGVGNKENVELLLDRGADVNAMDNFNSTPLHKAAEANNVLLTKLLLVRSADVNTRDMLGFTPLHQAVLRNRTLTAELLITNGADVSLKNNEGLSAYDLAVQGGNAAMIKLLKAK